MASKKWPRPDRSFHLPIYGGRVYLYRSVAAYDAALAFLRQAPREGHMEGVCRQLVNDSDGDGDVIYVVGWFSDRPSTLVHECAHLAAFALQRAGIDIRDSNAEAYCYLLSDILERLGLDDKNGVAAANAQVPAPDPCRDLHGRGSPMP